MNSSSEPIQQQQIAQEMILHICRKMEGEKCGATLLNKILYYADHAYYLAHGSTISGMSYIKQRKGPTPKPSEFLPLRTGLIVADELEIKPEPVFGYLMHRHVAKRDARIDVFSQEQIDFIESTIEQFKSYSATEASEISHNAPWLIANEGDELPTFSYLITRHTPSSLVVDKARELIAT